MSQQPDSEPLSGSAVGIPRIGLQNSSTLQLGQQNQTLSPNSNLALQSSGLNVDARTLKLGLPPAQPVSGLPTGGLVLSPSRQAILPQASSGLPASVGGINIGQSNLNAQSSSAPVVTSPSVGLPLPNAQPAIQALPQTLSPTTGGFKLGLPVPQQQAAPLPQTLSPTTGGFKLGLPVPQQQAAQTGFPSSGIMLPSAGGVGLGLPVQQQQAAPLPQTLSPTTGGIKLGLPVQQQQTAPVVTSPAGGIKLGLPVQQQQTAQLPQTGLPGMGQAPMIGQQQMTQLPQTGLPGMGQAPMIGQQQMTQLPQTLSPTTGGFKLGLPVPQQQTTQLPQTGLPTMGQAPMIGQQQMTQLPSAETSLPAGVIQSNAVISPSSYMNSLVRIGQAPAQAPVAQGPGLNQFLQNAGQGPVSALNLAAFQQYGGAAAHQALQATATTRSSGRMFDLSTGTVVDGIANLTSQMNRMSVTQQNKQKQAEKNALKSQQMALQMQQLGLVALNPIFEKPKPFFDHVKQKWYVINPESGRACMVDGDRGRKIAGDDICMLYPRMPGFVPPPFRDFQHACQQYFYDSIMSNDELRGMLLYHGLGAGKTATSISIADMYLDNVQPHMRTVYVITNGSLRENFLSQYCTTWGTHLENTGQYFKFITMNYPKILEKLPPNFNNSLILVDEVHNLINGKTNGGNVLTQIYDMIDSAQNTKILLLSGTPIVAHDVELYFLGRLLKPKMFHTFSEDQFKGFFVDQARTLTQEQMQDPDLLAEVSGVMIPQDENTFRNLFSGFISYVPYVDDPDDFDKGYPDTQPEEFVNVDIQNNAGIVSKYIEVREKEIELSQFPPSEDLKYRNPAEYKEKRRNYYLAISLLLSRQLSNVYYPEMEVLKEVKTRVGRQTYSSNQMVMGTIKDTKVSDSVAPSGWITTAVWEALPDLSPKMTRFIYFLQEVPGKHVIYSEFKEYHGTHFITAVLKLAGVTCESFDGDMDDTKRKRVLEQFNNTHNLNGEICRVLVITSAGSEGLNLLHVRMIHVWEQYISEWPLTQVKGRANRYKAHQLFPVNDRKMRIIRYMFNVENYRGVVYFGGKEIQITDENPLPNERYSSDYVSYKKAIIKEKSITHLQSLMKDCNITTRDYIDRVMAHRRANGLAN